MSRQTDSARKLPVWRLVAVVAVVLVAIGIVVLKPRGDSTTPPSAVSPPRTEVTREQRLSEPTVSAPPPSRPEVATEQRSGEAAVAAPPPSTTEVNPPQTAQPQTKLPLLLDIGSTTCIPCKRMAPILEELKEEYQGIIEVKFIDIYRQRYAARKYRIIAIPTQIFYDTEGREFDRHLGFMGREEILQVFRKMGVDL